MRTGRPKAELVLSEEERAALERYARRGTLAQQLGLRARIVLRSAAGLDNKTVAHELGIWPVTVGKWRQRFVAQRLDGLLDEPRPGTPRKISDEQVEQVVIRTLESTSQRKLQTLDRCATGGEGARYCGALSQPAGPGAGVVRGREVADSGAQSHAADLPMRPGQTERRTPDYFRYGTTSLFAALDVKTGAVIGQCHRRHRSLELRKFLDAIDQAVPQEFEIHLIIDNYSTHKSAMIRNWLAKRPRYHVHFTPTGGSWLNQVERWFALLTQRAIKRGSHTSTSPLERAIREFIDAHNQEPKPFIWRKSADDILASIARFADRTNKIHAPN